MNRKPKQIFLQRKHRDGQKAHEEMFYITNYQRNAHQNYNEVSFYTSLEWPSSKCLQILNCGEGVEKKESFYTIS